jgi:[protein-PII] uridylyltransferase
MTMLNEGKPAGPAVWRRWGGESASGLLGRPPSRAAGPGSWHRAAGSLAEQRELVEAELARLGRPELVDMLDALPDYFLVARPAASVADHVVLAAEPLATGQTRARVRARETVGTWELLVVARDQPGLLATMAGVLAMRDVSVLAAVAATRDDGVALDAFAVTTPPGGWSGLAVDLTGALSGRRSLDEWLAQHPAELAAVGEARPIVTVDNGRSDEYSVVDVSASDRPGLLFRIARALYELGLDVHSAEIETRLPGVVDTFYVRTLDGAKLDDVAAGGVARTLEEQLSIAPAGP